MNTIRRIAMGSSLLALVAAGLVGIVTAVAPGKVAGTGMTGIYGTVGQDAADAYELAVRNNDTSSACMQAGLARSAYLSAKDEVLYKRWSSVEREVCASR